MEHSQSAPLTEQSPFFLGEARIDPPALSIEYGGVRRHLESKVMLVLLVLAREPGRVVSRHTLEREVWPGRVVTDDAVTNAIVKLRRALNDTPRNHRVIETIAKSGYRLKLVPEAAFDEAASPVASESKSPIRNRRKWRPFAAVLLSLVAITFLVQLIRSPPEQPTGSMAVQTLESIAVMPFAVVGEDRTQAYFAEGITLDLITALSRLPRLLVIAPGTVFGYRDTEWDDRRIASELDVHYLIRGGVQRESDQVRINVQLVEAAQGQTIWAKRFSGDIDQVFEFQDAVVEAIAGALQTRLALSAESLERTGATQSIAAYDEFLRGQEYYGRRTPDDNSAAQHHFGRAVILDPNFARAYAGLALVWSRLAIDGWTADVEGALRKAETFAGKAASIDASVPQIHFVRGQVALFRGQHAHAAAAVKTALQLNPNYADAYALLAWVLHYSGRPDQAWPALHEALERNPSSSASYREIAGEIHFATGHYQRAVREFAAALERNPAHMRARLWLAVTLVTLGRAEEAAWEVEELQAINPEFTLSRLLVAFPFKDPHARNALTKALAQLELPE